MLIQIANADEALHVTGYPKDKASRQYTCSGPLVKVYQPDGMKTGVVLYNLDTLGGQSGAPVLAASLDLAASKAAITKDKKTFPKI